MLRLSSQNGAHGGAAGGRQLRRPGAARARACDGRVRGAAPGGWLRARLAARRGCGGISCAPIEGAGGVRCGRSGLVRLAAVGRAPRLRRASGRGVTACRVRFPVRRRAALVGGGIAPAPKFVVDMCVLEFMPAARAHAVCARAVRPRAGRVVHLCSVRSDRATSARQRRRHRGGAPGRALCWRCMLALSYLCPPCSRCVHLLCMRLVCTLAVCALALPMLALRVPAVPALAVRACAVRFGAVCGVLVQRSYTSCGARRPCIPVDPGDLP